MFEHYFSSMTCDIPFEGVVVLKIPEGAIVMEIDRAGVDLVSPLRASCAWKEVLNRKGEIVELLVEAYRKKCEDAVEWFDVLECYE